MIRDITIGQYYPAKSVLHRLDPRTKFLGTLGFLISVFLFHTFLGYAVATVFLVAMIAISKVPVKFMFKGLKAIVMILLITVVFNIILTPGEVLWRFGIIKVTKEGNMISKGKQDPSVYGIPKGLLSFSQYLICDLQKFRCYALCQFFC